MPSRGAEPASTPSDTPQDASDGSQRVKATAAVRRAQAAFQAGKYTAAIADFTEANNLRPAAKLEYNIGICHQRLHHQALEAGEREAEKKHADAAIDAFNRYLKARPTSEDRAAVEDLIRSLGGTPITSAALKPAPDQEKHVPGPIEAPVAASESGESVEPPPAATSDETEPPATAHLGLPRGSFAASFGLWFQPQLNAHATVEAASMIHLSLRGGVHLGARRRLFAGAGIGLAGGGKEHPQTKLGATALALDGLAGLRLPLGKGDRIVLPITAIIGTTREVLRTRNNMSTPTCSKGSGSQVGVHWGARLGARIGALVLLGPRRAHGLLFDLDVSASIYGKGSLAAGCELSPFEVLGLPPVRAIIGTSLGYNFRW